MVGNGKMGKIMTIFLIFFVSIVYLSVGIIIAEETKQDENGGYFIAIFWLPIVIAIIIAFPLVYLFRWLDK